MTERQYLPANIVFHRDDEAVPTGWPPYTDFKRLDCLYLIMENGTVYGVIGINDHGFLQEVVGDDYSEHLLISYSARRRDHA